MALALLIKGLSYLPKAYNFVKPFVSTAIAGIGKALSFISGVSGKIADIGGKVAVGIEAAKQIPGVGEYINKIDEGSGASKLIGDITNTAGKVGQFSQGVGKLLPTLMA